jgi:hypothetical protein
MPRRERQRKSGGKRAPEAHAKKIIPIDHATAEAITNKNGCSGKSSDANPDQKIHSF